MRARRMAYIGTKLTFPFDKYSGRLMAKTRQSAISQLGANFDGN